MSNKIQLYTMKQKPESPKKSSLRDTFAGWKHGTSKWLSSGRRDSAKFASDIANDARQMMDILRHPSLQITSSSPPSSRRESTTSTTEHHEIQPYPRLSLVPTGHWSTHIGNPSTMSLPGSTLLPADEHQQQPQYMATVDQGWSNKNAPGLKDKLTGQDFWNVQGEWNSK